MKREQNTDPRSDFKRNLLIYILFVMVIGLSLYINFAQHAMEHFVVMNYTDQTINKGDFKFELYGGKTENLPIIGPGDVKTGSKDVLFVSKKIKEFQITLNGETKILKKFDTTYCFKATGEYPDPCYVQFMCDAYDKGDVYGVQIWNSSSTKLNKSVFINRTHHLIPIYGVAYVNKTPNLSPKIPDNRDINLFENKDKAQLDSFLLYMPLNNVRKEGIFKPNSSGEGPNGAIGVELSDGGNFLDKLFQTIIFLIQLLSTIFGIIFFIYTLLS